MIMKYITEDILNFYHVNFFCAYFAEKRLKIIVLACYSFYIAILWAYFCREPHFKGKIHLLNMFVVT